MYINVILLMGNFHQNLMVGKSSMSQKVPFGAKTPHFLPLLTPWGGNQNFYQKSEKVTLPPLGSCNFIQNFRQIWWVAIENVGNGRKNPHFLLLFTARDTTRIFIKNPRMLYLLPWVVVTSCKILDKSNELLLRIVRTNGKNTFLTPFTPPPGTQREFS